jgi:hypothetical protein
MRGNEEIEALGNISKGFLSLLKYVHARQKKNIIRNFSSVTHAQNRLTSLGIRYSDIG